MNGPPGSSWLPNWSALDTRSMTLLIGWETSTRHVQVRRLPISRSVAEDLTQPVTETASRLASGTAIAYSPDLDLDDEEYAVVDRDQLDSTSTLLAGVEQLTPAEADKADLQRTLLFYAIAVGPATERLVFIRRANPRANLRNKYLTLFGDELARIDRPLLSFDLDLIDVVLVVGNGLAVLKLAAYERLFRDSPELLARTPAKVAELAAIMPLSAEATTALTEAATRNTRVRARLLAVLNRGHLATVDNTRLRAEMRRHGLDPTRHLVGGRLHFDADEAMSIMQLLNEDLTVGGLSDTPFIINKKSPRT